MSSVISCSSSQKELVEYKIRWEADRLSFQSLFDIIDDIYKKGGKFEICAWDELETSIGFISVMNAYLLINPLHLEDFKSRVNKIPMLLQPVNGLRENCGNCLYEDFIFASAHIKGRAISNFSNKIKAKSSRRMDRPTSDLLDTSFKYYDIIIKYAFTIDRLRILIIRDFNIEPLKSMEQASKDELTNLLKQHRYLPSEKDGSVFDLGFHPDINTAFDSYGIMVTSHLREIVEQEGENFFTQILELTSEEYQEILEKLGINQQDN